MRAKNPFTITSLSTIALLLLFSACVSDSGAESGTLRLEAKDNDGHDEQWESRPYYFTSSWGIRGSKEPESGSIWFNSFPGETAEYDITLQGIIERDGSAKFAVRADGLTLHSGEFGYGPKGKDCNARGSKGEIPLGRHVINKGQKISIWAESVYECGEKGAYALWHTLKFTKVQKSTRTLDN